MPPTAPFRCLLCLLAGMIAAAGPRAAETLAADESQAFEAALADFLRLRSTLSAERAAEAEEQALLDRERALLEAERQALLAERVRLHAPDAGDERNKTLTAEEVERLREDLAGAEAAWREAATRLRGWQPRLPPGLERSLDPALLALDAASDAPTRAQAVAAGWSRLRELALGWHAVTAFISTPEGSRKADVLYAGLSRGYAVSPDRSAAWIGRFDGQAWFWSPAPGRASDFARAHAMAARQTSPALIPLPAGDPP